jgi:Spy/CpxP family protein refolding chaperone
VGIIPQEEKPFFKIPNKLAFSFWHISCSVIFVMFIKRILKVGLVAIVASALTTVQAQVPKPAPKPDKEKPERGGKKWDSAKVKERLKAAFEKRRKNRGDAKKRGHKVHDRKKGDRKKDSGFGKLVRDDAKIKELKEAFAKATKERKGAFDRAGWKDATDEEKKALREKMTASRKEWAQQMRAHQKEVHARIKEIREEFKNKRDEVIDGNKPGE